jgi:ligand-binding sensor domain-containing protein/serine phosphatase RsbU (regulator of sigma subunit)
MVEKKTFHVVLVIIMVVLLPELQYPFSKQLKFRHLTLDDGLSQSSVRCILQDSVGFMWFGTEDGLNRFDGYEFNVYKPDPTDPNSIGSNKIAVLYEDSGGNIWIGTYGGGLNRFDREQEKFIRYRHRTGDPTSLSSDKVTAIREDRCGVLWVGTDDGGLNRLNRESRRSPSTGTMNTFTRYGSGTGSDGAAGLRSNSIVAICEDHSGYLWIGTRDAGLCRLDLERKQYKYFLANPGDPGSLNSDTILSLYEDHAGELWVGTEKGLHLFERSIERFVRYTYNPADAGSLSNNTIHVIYEDHAGVLWVGTDAGLNCFDRRSERFSRYFHEPGNPGSLSQNAVLDICESRSGVMWFGTDGGGVNIFDRQGEKFFHYWSIPGNTDSLSNNFVFNIEEDADGILWIATSGGGLNRLDPGENRYRWYRSDPNDPRSLSNDTVRDVHIDSKGRFWVATLGGGFNRFFPKTGTFKHFRAVLSPPGNSTVEALTSDYLRSIYEDRSGILWLGSDDGGLCRFDPDTETFITYLHCPGDPNSLSNNSVRAVLEDSKGVYWIGTIGGGLNRFHPETASFTRFKSKTGDPKGIPSDFISYIHEDKTGRLWFCTLGSGLISYNRENATFKQYRQKDGLPNDVTYGILEDDNGCLWISTNYGLTKFEPRSETFKNYTVRDGLQSNEFNGRSCFKGRDGRMFFGGINGLTAFYPGRIRDNLNTPPIIINRFSIFNKPVSVGPRSPLNKHISRAKKISLSYKQNVFSFEFVALDYTIPEKNRYAYRMEGFDNNWIMTSAKKRYVTYTNLDPGKYVFRVKGSNNDGIWNNEGTSVNITIYPPVWKTWWFTFIAIIAVAAIAVFLYRKRMKFLAREMRLHAQLKSIRDAQMAIMPQGDPMVPGFDISGECLPGKDVAGDFFDYIWLNEEKTRFGIVLGDVSKKIPAGAATAVISGGVLFSPSTKNGFIKEKITEITQPFYVLTTKQTFTTLYLATLNIYSQEMSFTAAGSTQPVLKNNTDGVVAQLVEENIKLPLGVLKEQKFKEKGISMKSGDVLLLFTDGVYRIRNKDGVLFQYHHLETLLREIETFNLSAAEIKQKVFQEIHRFAGDFPQQDDIVLVVVKTR